MAFTGQEAIVHSLVIVRRADGSVKYVVEDGVVVNLSDLPVKLYTENNKEHKISWLKHNLLRLKGMLKRRNS